jgi:hypothetical protein
MSGKISRHGTEKRLCCTTNVLKKQLNLGEYQKISFCFYFQASHSPLPTPSPIVKVCNNTVPNCGIASVADRHRFDVELYQTCFIDTDNWQSFSMHQGTARRLFKHS